MSMLIVEHYPAGFLTLVYCLTDSPQVALMPFWLLPFLNSNHLPLLTYNRHSKLKHIGNCEEFTNSKLIRGRYT